MRLRDLARARPGYGYGRLTTMLRREGCLVNRKRVYRLYREEGLSIRQRQRRRHVSSYKRQPRAETTRTDERWSIDFVSDELSDGRRIRALTVVDNFTRESPLLAVGRSMTGDHVTELLEALAREGRVPETISCDNGPEFISKAMDLWAYSRGVKLEFSRPGKPTDNAYIESFNSRLRQECLNQHWFETIEEARERIEKWREDYNTCRPHSSLGGLAPQEFKRAWAAKQKGREGENTSTAAGT